MKTDFDPFPVGQVFNPLPEGSVVCAEPIYSMAEVHYPARLQSMSLDSSLVTQNNNMVYTAGHINFCVDLPKIITVELNPTLEEMAISERTERKPLVKHAAKLMCTALGVDEGLEIDVVEDTDLRHCGLGSSSAVVAGVAAAINEIYGKPLSPSVISRYCSQNHGEEIDGDEQYLMPVQCLGGSAICGHFEGGLIISAGQSVPIYRHNLDEQLGVVFGLPKDFKPPDAKQTMQAEIDNSEGFRKTGELYGAHIAYRLVHEVLPALLENNLKPCKDLIFDYRWDMGSIANCSFTYPSMTEIAENLRELRDDEALSILSLSSVGPGFFALTDQPDYVEDKFINQGMGVIRMPIHNGTYRAITR